MVLNGIVGIIALLIVLGVWLSVHLLAQRQLGVRKLGCSGPRIDYIGRQVCCHGHKLCDQEEKVPGQS